MATVVDPRIHAGAEAASQWRLMWWSFRRHWLAMTGLAVVLLLYLIALFAEFVAPFDPQDANRRALFHPPQMIHFIDATEDGGWRLNPYVYNYTLERDKFTREENGERVPLSDHDPLAVRFRWTKR